MVKDTAQSPVVRCLLLCTRDSQYHSPYIYYQCRYYATITDVSEILCNDFNKEYFSDEIIWLFKINVVSLQPNKPLFETRKKTNSKFRILRQGILTTKRGQKCK